MSTPPAKVEDFADYDWLLSEAGRRVGLPPSTWLLESLSCKDLESRYRSTTFVASIPGGVSKACLNSNRSRILFWMTAHLASSLSLYSCIACLWPSGRLSNSLSDMIFRSGRREVLVSLTHCDLAWSESYCRPWAVVHVSSQSKCTFCHQRCLRS